MSDWNDHMLHHINVQLSAANMATYTELREALRQALYHAPLPEVAKILPVLVKAGGSL